MTLANQDVGTDPTAPVIRGDTIRLEFTVAGLSLGDVASAEWRLADRTPAEASPQTLITKTSGAGITTAHNPPSSVGVTVLLDPTDTQTLAPGDYYHELEITRTGGGDVNTAATGTLRFTGDVVP